METFLLLCWLAKIIGAQRHLHHTVKLLLLSVPGRHRPPSEASQEPKEPLQLCRTRVLCGGPDPADLARGCSLQGKKELLTAPLWRVCQPQYVTGGCCCCQKGKWESVESWLAGFGFQQQKGSSAGASWSFQPGRCLFASLHAVESMLRSSPLSVGADGQLSLGATGQQGGCRCRAACDPSADDRLASQCRASGTSLTSNSTGCACGEVWVGFFCMACWWRES